MKTFRSFLGVIGLGLILFISGCEQQGPTAPTVYPEESKTKAQQALDALTSSLEQVRSMEEFSPGEVDFSEADRLYKEAIELDPSNTQAQFGAAITAILMVLQNEEVQAVIDSLQNFMGEEAEASAPVFGIGIAPNAKRIALTPKLIYGMAKSSVQQRRSRRVAKSTQEVLRVSDIQRVIEQHFIPALDYALERLAVVEQNPDFQFILTPEFLGDEQQSSLEVDLGEVYVLDAQIRVLKAFLLIATAYNLDFDDNGSYDFLWDPSDAEALRQLKRLDEDSDFLTLRSLDKLPAAGQNLLAAIQKLEDAVGFIREETDVQDDDIIKQQHIEDLDSEVDLTGRRDVPQFLQDVDSVEKVLSKLREVLSGPVEIDADFNGDGQPEFLTVNLSVFFTDPVQSLKGLLPYHKWHPENFENVEIFDDFALTDAAGNKLGENDPPLVLPDPTFGGLFPDLTTNQAFLDFFGITREMIPVDIDPLNRSTPGRIFVSNETPFSLDIRCLDSQTEELISSPTTIGPGETREISGGSLRSDTEVIVEVMVKTQQWISTETIWVWIDGDVTIHIYGASQYGINYWQESEWWG